MPVKVEQINEYLLSDTVQSPKTKSGNKKCTRSAAYIYMKLRANSLNVVYSHDTSPIFVLYIAGSVNRYRNRIPIPTQPQSCVAVHVQTIQDSGFHHL